MTSMSARILRPLVIASALGLSSLSGIAAATTASAAAPVRTHAASHPVHLSAKNTVAIRPDTTLGHIVNFNSGLCLGISGGARNAPAVQFTCLNHPDQIWHTGGTNSAGYYQIINNTGECLGVTGGSAAQGKRVVGWQCLGTSHPDQYWFIGRYVCPGNYYLITNYHSQLVLGVSGNSTANGAAVVQWHYQGVCNNQFWGYTG